MSKIKLKDVVFYSKERIPYGELKLESYVSTENLLQNKQGVTRIDALPASINNTTKYSAGNILISNIRPYLKKIWYAKNDGGVSSDVLTFVVRNDFDSRFVYYNLFQDMFFDHTMAGSKGTKMPRGDKNQILEFEIPNLNLPTQQKIASVLSTLDDKIELNSKINAELEAMVKTLYDYWFIQFDFPNAHGKPYKSSGGKMVWNDALKREIPERWEVKELGDIAAINAGGDKPDLISKVKTEDYRIPIFSNGSTNEGLYGYTKLAKISEPSITISARGTIGYTVLRNESYFPIIRLISIIPKVKYRALFFYYEIKNLVFENSGSVQQQLTVPHVSKLRILNPASAVLNSFFTQTNQIIKKIDLNKKQNHELASLRDWLLPMLMNGQVTVAEAKEKVGMVAEGSVSYK
ncbi:restriction endonuclease subunit S [Flavobacterium psychrotrophum]|uniref:restriction endonuclease subunit S n=1 Tax=Flavobacterium psychrotrophum TaxID=2294119 RepID=UPI000E317F8F|nr:restriction endonuclease subunit S [Flavobacterium psychrotrophum]